MLRNVTRVQIAGVVDGSVRAPTGRGSRSRAKGDLVELVVPGQVMAAARGALRPGEELHIVSPTEVICCTRAQWTRMTRAPALP